MAVERAPPAYNATLRKRIDVTPRLTIFQVTPDREFGFVAGQYTVLGLRRSESRIPEADAEEIEENAPDKLIRRAYSISSGSRTREYVEFYISLVSSGELTPRLFALDEGERLFMGTKPKGLFTLDRVPEDRNILMVATGTGLAPYISMLRSLADGCPTRRIAVLHGASYSWDLGYRNELEELAGRCGNFAYLPVVSRPGACVGWSGRTGRLPAWLDKRELEKTAGLSLSPDATHVFLCGNPGMIEDAEEILSGKGYPLGNRQETGSLHVEKYW